MGLTYEQSGVRGLGKEKSRTYFASLRSTLSFLERRTIETPFYTLYEVRPSLFHATCCDGVGTKALLAALARDHTTIGIDAVASVTNDLLRVGARPIALTNSIDSPNPEKELVQDIHVGLMEGAKQARCAIVGGETASLGDMLSAPYVLNCSCVGEVEEERIIRADDISVGDAIIGLPSSGVHCNGISLLRHALFREWGGKYDAFERVDGLDNELVRECLIPTRIYVNEVLSLYQRVAVKASAHITGDAYAKFQATFGKPGIGFAFNSFSPQPIFSLIQSAGDIADEEMFRRFNMGWGFALIVSPEHAEEVLQALSGSQVIGSVTDSGHVTIEYREKVIRLT